MLTHLALYLFFFVLIVAFALCVRVELRRAGWRWMDGRILINKPPTEEQIIGSFALYPKLAAFLQRARQSSTLAELRSLRAEVATDCKGWAEATPFGKKVSTLLAIIDIKQETIRLQDRVNAATSREELQALRREIDELARKRGWAYHAIVGGQVRQLNTCVHDRLGEKAPGGMVEP